MRMFSAKYLFRIQFFFRFAAQSPALREKSPVKLFGTIEADQHLKDERRDWKDCVDTMGNQGINVVGPFGFAHFLFRILNRWEEN